MAIVVLGDRILVTTTTTGTGTYQLGSAVTGFLTFALAGVSTGARVPYVVVDSLTAPTEFEIGEGIYTFGTPSTLARTQVRRNTSGGTSAINWGAGTKYVLLAPSAANLPVYDTNGALTAATAVGGTNDTTLATTAFVVAAIAGKANLASPTFTGTPAAPTAAAATNTTQLATTAFVQQEIAGKAPLNAPAFTGAPTVPTPLYASNNTTIANTAFVAAALLGGVVRAWCRFTPGGTVLAGFNVSSITKGGTGHFTFNFTSALPSTNYCAYAAPTPNYVMPIGVSGYSTGSVAMQFANVSTSTSADPTADTTMFVLGG